eukprot:6182669-Pleurochrysis_carterae.AAC.2
MNCEAGKWVSFTPIGESSPLEELNQPYWGNRGETKSVASTQPFRSAYGPCHAVLASRSGGAKQARLDGIGFLAAADDEAPSTKYVINARIQLCLPRDAGVSIVAGTRNIRCQFNVSKNSPR